MSLSDKSSMESARRKFFMNTTYIMSKSRNETFLGSGGQNESKFSTRRKFFMGSWRPQQMSLSAKRSLQSPRRKFFMNSTYIMSRK